MSSASSASSSPPPPSSSSSPTTTTGRLVNPLALLRAAYEDGVETCVLENVGNEQRLVLRQRNCYIEAGVSSGIESRKREVYSIADVWLLLSTPKEAYNYLAITEKGHRYINVLERPRIQHAVTGPLPRAAAADEAAAAAAGGVAAAAAAATAQETAAAEAAALLATHKQQVYAIDPSKPIRLPGDEETAETQDTAAAAAAAAAAQKQKTRRWLLPQWFEGEPDLPLWGVLEDGTNTSSSSNSSSNNSSLQLLRLQRPLFPRAAAVLTRGVSFAEVLNDLVAIEKARRAKRPLDIFFHKAFNPQQRSGGAASADTAAAPPTAARPQQQRRTLGGSLSLLGRPRAPPSTSRFCLLDEVCVHLKRRPLLLLPSLASSGSGCLLTRDNVKLFLEGGGFVDPREAHKAAVASGAPSCPDGVLIRRTIRNRDYTFKALECTYTSKFERQDWASVVAVFVGAGSAEKAKWQFNGWPFSNWVDLFQSYRGALFAYDEDAIPADVLQWNIRVFRLSRSHRYNDAAAANDFWRFLEEFLLSPRQLRLSSTKKLLVSNL